MKPRVHAGGRGPVGRRVPGMSRALIAMLCLMMFPCGPVHAAGGGNTAEEVGLGIASAIVTIPYSASKIVYAGVGGIIGGFTWILSGGDTGAADAVWDASLHGTYVITPDHLQGREPVRFIGRLSDRDDEYAN